MSEDIRVHPLGKSLSSMTGYKNSASTAEAFERHGGVAIQVDVALIHFFLQLINLEVPT